MAFRFRLVFRVVSELHLVLILPKVINIIWNIESILLRLEANNEIAKTCGSLYSASS